MPPPTSHVSWLLVIFKRIPNLVLTGNFHASLCVRCCLLPKCVTVIRSHCCQTGTSGSQQEGPVYVKVPQFCSAFTRHTISHKATHQRTDSKRNTDAVHIGGEAVKNILLLIVDQDSVLYRPRPKWGQGLQGGTRRPPVIWSKRF